MQASQTRRGRTNGQATRAGGRRGRQARAEAELDDKVGRWLSALLADAARRCG